MCSQEGGESTPYLYITPNIQWVKGAAANMFQKNAIGKFFITVPTHIAGSCAALAPPRITLNSIDAARLIVGHMTATVPA